MGQKIDTRAVGLDIGLAFTKWLTGAENLHYGYWDGLEVTAGNLRAAQDAYTTKLFDLLPKEPCRILDIGGGAGETARKLLALGHQVDIVVPSKFLADRCRDTAAGATVHEMIFEDFETTQTFDICMFSESFQYIDLNVGLAKALSMLAEGGHVIVSDCFRNPDYFAQNDSTIVGGGHPMVAYRELLETLPIDVVFEEDITEHTAPSVEIEQGLFNVVGFAVDRVDTAMQEKKPALRWIAHKLWRLITTPRRREKLDKRVNGTLRNRVEFTKYTNYIMMKITPKQG